MWQHLPGYVDPVLVSAGPLKISYYGLSHLAAALTVYGLVMYRLRTEKISGFNPKALTAGFPWIFLGSWLGARLFFALLNWEAYFRDQPWTVVLPFTWADGWRYVGIRGMSSHGGLIGLTIAGWFFCASHKINFWKLGDLLATALPLGYTWGRIGNFINEDFLGRVTTMPWGMYFEADPGRLRHPVQLYEAFLEGVVLFAVLWSIRKQKRPEGFFLAVFLIGYSLLRFPLEYLKDHERLYFGHFTPGQILCVLTAFIGLLILFFRKNSRPASSC